MRPTQASVARILEHLQLVHGEEDVLVSTKELRGLARDWQQLQRRVERQRLQLVRKLTAHHLAMLEQAIGRSWPSDHLQPQAWALELVRSVLGTPRPADPA